MGTDHSFEYCSKTEFKQDVISNVLFLSALCFIDVQAGGAPIHCPDDTYYYKKMCCPAANCEITGDCSTARAGMSKISSICNSEFGKSKCCQTCMDHWVDDECKYGNISTEKKCESQVKWHASKASFCASDFGKKYCCAWCKYGPRVSNKAVKVCGA